MLTICKKQNDRRVILKSKPVMIGSKYKPDHTWFYDGRSGEYWCSNPPMESASAIKLQKALLRKVRLKIGMNLVKVYV